MSLFGHRGCFCRQPPDPAHLYEILTIATWPLVIHHEDESAIMGGRKYLIYTLTAGCTLLLAIGITYSLAGTLDFTGGGFLAGHGSPGLLILLLTMFIAGFGVKAGIMPFHEWLPSAMVAPTPVSALLHAVAVVKAGVFGCVRVILFVFGPDLLQQLGVWTILAGVVAFTVVVAGLLALGQDHLKRRLAFSTINNLALIILGVSLLNKNAMTGGILHIANHAFMKITLFFCAGAIYAKTIKIMSANSMAWAARCPLPLPLSQLRRWVFQEFPGSTALSVNGFSV